MKDSQRIFISKMSAKQDPVIEGSSNKRAPLCEILAGLNKAAKYLHYTMNHNAIVEVNTSLKKIHRGK